MKKSSSFVLSSILLTFVFVLSGCTTAVEEENKEVTPTETPSTDLPSVPSTDSAEAEDWKEFSEASMTMQYPADWSYSSNKSFESTGYFLSANIEEQSYEVRILPQGEFDHDLPFEEPKKEEITIDGKKAQKSVWENAGVSTGLIILTDMDLPSGWTAQNRIEFYMPNDKLDQVNQMLDSIKWQEVSAGSDTDELKTFEEASASLSMEHPAYWNYKTAESFGQVGHFFSFNEEDQFSILPGGEFDHGLPSGDAEIDEDVVIGGKKAHKKVWKSESDKAIGYIVFSELPAGWNEHNRIEFLVPYDKLEEVEKVLSSIKFN